MFIVFPVIGADVKRHRVIPTATAYLKLAAFFDGGKPGCLMYFVFFKMSLDSSSRFAYNSIHNVEEESTKGKCLQRDFIW